MEVICSLILTLTDTIRTDSENALPAFSISWSSSSSSIPASGGLRAIAQVVCSALFFIQHQHYAHSLPGTSVRTTTCTTHHATIRPCLRSSASEVRNESITITYGDCMECGAAIRFE